MADDITKGFPRVRLVIQRLKDDAAELVKEEVVGTAIDIRNTVILSMRNTPKTGRVYRRQKGKKRHVASSPGNPPAIDTGELIRSITTDARRRTVEVGAEIGAPHSLFLEKGTDKMGARPFLEPAMDKHLPELENKIKRAIIGSVRGLG